MNKKINAVILAVLMIMSTLPVVFGQVEVAVPNCNCDSEAGNILEHHTDTVCERKEYCKTISFQYTAEELYDMSFSMPDDVKNFIITYMGSRPELQDKFAKLDELLNESVNDAQDTTVQTQIHEKMISFVDIVSKLPEEDSVEAFYNALSDYAEIHALAGKDTPLPDSETGQYESAYRSFAAHMGYDPENIEVTYPDSELDNKLRSDIFEAFILFEETEALCSSLPASQAAASEADQTQANSAADLSESYMSAKAKLDAIIAVKPDLLENDNISLMARDLGNGISTVDGAEESIRINLFNFGPQINSQAPGYGLLPFTHSEGTYGWAVDSTGNNPAGSSGGWPLIQTSLSASQKFPYILSDKNNVIKAGSLGYLFDPACSGAGRIDVNTYLSNISSNASSGYNPFSYASVYFPVDNSDGEGTGLFQKEGSYYVYDSGKNAAWYDPETKKFELYNYVVRPAYTTFAISGTNGNFLPFNQGHTQGREDYQSETYVKEFTYTNASGESVNANATVAKTETVATKPEGALTAYRLYGNSRTNEVDLWFGLTMEFDFYQPEGGRVDNAPMEFEFLGDDDVFVYIDDILILDIGGIHGAQTGKINFQNGTVINPSGYGQYGTADKASSTIYELMKAALGDSVDDSEFIDSDGDGRLDTFSDYTKHNLKFFYMERGGNISYCRLKFNMDPLPNGSLSVEKKEENLNEEFVGKEEYEFQLERYEKSDDGTYVKDDDAVFEYTVVDPYNRGNANSPKDHNDEDGKNESITGTDGKLKLKGGQTAVITGGIVVTDKIIVKELSSGDYTTACIVNGGSSSETSATSEILIEAPDNEHSVIFNNTYNDLFGSLTVTKKGISELDNNETESQSSIFKVESVSFVNENVEPVELEITIKGNDSVTVTNLPAGTYKVTEISCWSWRYSASQDKTEDIVTVEETPVFTFTNTRTEPQWLSGDSCLKNLWPLPDTQTQ